MTRSLNQQSLIDQVETVGSIDSRFENIECKSAPIGGDRKGCFSLVFSADDIAENKTVAIKFMDPDKIGRKYRLAAFDREPEILKKLKNKKRCLKLVFGPDTFNWKFNTPGGISSLPVNYFITDWLEEDVEGYFLDQQNFEALVKLKIFESALLAVQAFHNEDVAHRDIKGDNLRGYIENGELIIVVIDFGTAVHIEDPLATPATEYPPDAVGAPAYSAPEAIIGLASTREVGKLTDIYALGALLFQLFNPSLFHHARMTNSHFHSTLVYMQARLAPLSSDTIKVETWQSEVKKFKFALEPPSLASPGNTAPKSIVDMLSRAHREMTLFDFADRKQELFSILRVINSCIKVLENHRLDNLRKQRKIKLKQLKNEKLKRKEQKLLEYLKKKPLITNRC